MGVNEPKAAGSRPPATAAEMPPGLPADGFVGGVRPVNAHTGPRRSADQVNSAAPNGPSKEPINSPAGQGRSADGVDVPVGAGGAPQSVRVDIAELVLDGFGRLDPDRVAAAFQRELTRLVTAHGVGLAADEDVVLELLTGLPELPRTSSAHRLGEELARAVHTGLSGGRRPAAGRRRR